MNSNLFLRNSNFFGSCLSEGIWITPCPFFEKIIEVGDVLKTQRIGDL